jgi:hypothetical protein
MRQRLPLNVCVAMSVIRKREDCSGAAVWRPPRRFHRLTTVVGMMPRIPCIPVFLALVCCLAPAPGAAQTLKGRVLEQGSDLAIDVAKVVLVDSLGKEAGKALTDGVGAFRIVPEEAGTYRLRVERLGYTGGTSETVVLSEREITEIEIRLSTQPLPVAALTVKSRRSLPPRLDMVGFTDRKRAGFGHFVTRDQLKRMRHSSLSDVLRMVPGVVVRGGGGAPGARSSIQMGRSSALSDCRPTIYLDNVPVQKPLAGRIQGAPDPNVEDLVGADDIEGLEVYRGISEVPMMYGGKQARCGVIVIWTRTAEDEDERTLKKSGN